MDRALAAPGGEGAFPTDVRPFEVALPDRWADTRPEFDGSLWYRTGFLLPAAQLEEIRRRANSGDLLAVNIERVCTSFELHLNGQLVHRAGRMTEPLAYHCNQPQLVTLPTALLREGPNLVDVRVAAQRVNELASESSAGGLSALLVGPQPQLAAVHARQLLGLVTLPQATAATLVLLGGFMFVLGFVNRQDSHLAYFGALSLGWALLDARLWLRGLPLGHTVVEFLLCTLVGFIAWAAVQFLLRYAGVRLAWVDRALPTQAAMMPLTLVLAGAGQMHAMATLWYLALALEVVAAAAYYLVWSARATHGGRRSRGLMAVLMAAVALAGLARLLDPWSVERWTTTLAVNLIVPVVLMIVGMRLVQQQGRALQHAQQDKKQLEERVREATAEVENKMRQLAELRVEQVTERERKRIAADLHDDLGAKLLTIVHTSESDRISTLAREALEEMRLSVRGLTGKAVRLSDALGDWRAEVVSRLAQAGIESEWEGPEDLPQRLSARAYVQTTRILREATSNIIKHSGASHCAVTARVAEGDLQLVVQDNGNGIAPDAEGRLDRGHGLASMKNRAKQLQGQCLVESGPGWGTVIRLTMPLDRALEAS
jgi:signal transduction histidine kinase